jgi:hypothetical protein
MRSVVLACASVAALLAASPAFANCSTDIGRVERSVEHLRSGPNTRAAVRELDRARASRSESVCERHVHSAAAYAKRSAQADRAGERRHARAPLRRAARYDERYDERPN